MKVRVVVTVEVDEKGWQQDYGVFGAVAIRQDVSSFIYNAALESSDNFSIPERN